MAITTALTPLDRTSPTFRQDLDNYFLTTLPAFASEANDLADEVNADAAAAAASEAAAAGHADTANDHRLAAADSAQDAANSAAAAAAVAGAGQWVSGTVYAAGQCAWSTLNFQTYRRKTAGAGMLDPSLDESNWQSLGGGGMPTVELVAGTSVSGMAGKHYVLTNAALTTLELPDPPAPGAAVWITVANGRADNLINPGTKTISGPGGTSTGNLVLDSVNPSFQLRYLDDTRQWRIL